MTFCQDFPTLCNAEGQATNPTGPSWQSVWGPYNTPAGTVIGGNVHTPNVLTTGGGQSVLQTNLDKILASGLSALALLQGAKKVPTTLDPVDNYGGGYNPATLALLQAQGGGNNTAGNLQTFIQQNKGAVIIGGVILAAFLMKPPTRR